MKKVININFQGRVIPIEESAYNMLKEYVESLRKFFANEEGRDEIINDIEGRIAELFVESLKKGSTCITDEDVRGVIESMGRPEDFEGEESRVHAQVEDKQASHDSGEPGYQAPPRGRLYRDDSDKMLGGVCGGVASYLRIDPTIVRLVFALIAFVFGGGILLYIILWIILPSKPLVHTPSTKRLFRNPEEKVIGGVAAGIASYFDIAVWIPRLIFALPLVAGIATSLFRSALFFDVDPFPGILFGSFGGTLFIVYAVLWAVIPEAKTASEKLEMRGEKVDLNTIKNTIQEDLEGFKQRAEKWGSEAKDKAESFARDFGQTVKQKGKQFSNEVNYTARRTGSGIGHAIGIMFKAFFLFIAGIVAFALLITLLGFMVAGVGVFPLKEFFLEGIWQNFLAWTTLVLFLGVPVVAFITWVIRRIMGVRSKNRYLGFTFAGLWVLGLIAAVLLTVSIARNFDARARDTQEYAIQQPATGKLIVKVPSSKVKVIGRWFRMDGVLSATDDSLTLNNVRLRIVKSKDSLFHMTAAKYANGTDEDAAIKNIREINYGFNQQDSTVWLDRGFSVKRGTRFRNQAVAVILQVPVGKRVLIDHSVRRRLNWFHVGFGRNDWEWEEDYNDYQYYNDDVEYIMTPGGLERVDEQRERAKSKRDKDNEDDDKSDEAREKYKQSREELQREYERKQKEAEELKKELDAPLDSTRYRYQKSTTAIDISDATERISLKTA